MSHTYIHGISKETLIFLCEITNTAYEKAESETETFDNLRKAFKETVSKNPFLREYIINTFPTQAKQINQEKIDVNKIEYCVKINKVKYKPPGSENKNLESENNSEKQSVQNSENNTENSNAQKLESENNNSEKLEVQIQVHQEHETEDLINLDSINKPCCSKSLQNNNNQEKNFKVKNNEVVVINLDSTFFDMRAKLRHKFPNNPSIRSPY